jgi:pantetheine-phosphate adenylyltransferase
MKISDVSNYKNTNNVRVNNVSFKAKGIYAGSFDPFTNGHYDVVERGRKLFDELAILVANNPSKQGFLPIEERVRLIKESVSSFKNVIVDSWSQLVVNYAKQHNIEFLLRGMRNGRDFEEEVKLAFYNRGLSRNKIQTVFLDADPQNIHISSTDVRKIHQMHEDVSAFVPAPVARYLNELTKKQQVK